MFVLPEEKSIESRGVASENELKPHTYQTNPKTSDSSKLVAVAGSKSIQSTGSASTTVSNFMQWEAKLPPSQNNGSRSRQKVSIQNLVARIQGNKNEDIVDLSTEDKICVVMYPPTGSKFSSFKLNSSGTILTISFRIHQLMWDPDAVYYCIQDSPRMSNESEARMDERHRSMKDSIRSHFHSKSKNGRLPREHTMTVTLKRRADPDKVPIFIPYVFDVSDANKDQLTLCYFELDIFKPRIKRTPEKIEIDRIVYIDTKNNGNSNGQNTNNQQQGTNSNGRGRGANDSSQFQTRSSSSRTSFGGGYGCNLNDDEDSDDYMDISSNDNSKDDDGHGHNADIAEDLEATKKEMEEKDIEMILLKNEIDQLKEEKDQNEIDLCQKYDALKVTFEQKMAEAEIAIMNAEKCLIDEKHSKFELEEKLEETTIQHRLICKQNDQITSENKSFCDKISSLENDMEKHIKVGEALMKRLEKENGNDAMATTALVLFDEHPDLSSKKRRRSYHPAPAAI